MDTYIIHNILSYVEPSRNYLFLLSKNTVLYNEYLQLIRNQERKYTNKIMNFVCKPAFYMDVIDDSYSNYEQLKNYLRLICNIPYSHSYCTLKIYDLEQYINIIKDLSHYLTHIGIKSIPEEKKYNLDCSYNYSIRYYNRNSCNIKYIYKKKYTYKKKYIYNQNVYALLLVD